MADELRDLRERLSMAREAQKAADTAVGLLEGLVGTLENLHLDPTLGVVGVGQSRSCITLSFTVPIGVAIVRDAPRVSGPENVDIVLPDLKGAPEPTPAPAPTVAPFTAAEDAEKPYHGMIPPKAAKTGAPSKKTGKAFQPLKRWSLKEIAKARDMVASGYSAKQIAATMGRPIEGVKSKLQELEPRKTHARWSEAELATAKKMYRAGATGKEIAQAVGRPVPGTIYKLRKIRAECEAEDAAARQAPPAIEPAPVPPAAAPREISLIGNAGAGQGASMEAPDMPPSERRVETRLNDLGNPPEWPVDLDLEMVELLAGGTSALDAATILEMTKADVVARFRALCPQPTIENQKTLLAVLRRRAEQEQAA